MTLLVIDMQKSFKAVDNRTISNVRKFISEAKKQKKEIIIVEYRYNGPTVPEILEEVEGYDNYKVIHKSNDGGAPEVVKATDSDYFEACGVNLSYCVGDTVLGLLERKKKVKLLMDGINCIADKHWQSRVLEKMKVNGVEIHEETK